MATIGTIQITTNELTVRNNNLPTGEFVVAPKFTRSIGTVDDTHAFTQLKLEIKNSKENPFPADIIVDITGIFEVSNFPDTQITDFLKYQAVQILLPYIRNMVSSATSTCLMPPILLPLFNARELFPENDDNNPLGRSIE